MRRVARFIPFQGCARRCVYCDQAAITRDAGGGAPIVAASVASELMAEESPVELCFFGGSFARQSRSVIAGLLDSVRSAPVGSLVSFSSYPGDFYGPGGDSLISLLHDYPIGTIELGVPSLDRGVLSACGRPEDPEDIIGAIVKLRDAGFHIGVQVMTGLPGQSYESAARDMRRIGALMGGCGPWDLRIYPCLVLKGTELEAMYRDGAYEPQSLETAVREVGALLAISERLGFKAIRVGLQGSRSLEEAVAAGPWHPAFGELALSEATALELAATAPGGPWVVDRKKISRLTGHGGRGASRLSELTGIPPEMTRHLLTYS
ncbi:MAG: radical SAM protein [Synergistaceae bacterium]|jgi:histone acetyltransferase (RNA polymerase elongator complex component)|nr:radical SAM protein [Synergistaceae bacterium]